MSQGEGLCKSLPGAVCLASSRGRGGQLSHVPIRGNPSTPKAQEASGEGTPELVKEGVLSQLNFDRSSPLPQPSGRSPAWFNPHHWRNQSKLCEPAGYWALVGALWGFLATVSTWRTGGREDSEMWEMSLSRVTLEEFPAHRVLLWSEIVQKHLLAF